MTSADSTTIDGHIEHVIFHNDDNHYTIAKFRSAAHQNLLNVVGYMPDPNPGERLSVTGTWETHPRFGRQFRIQTFDVLLPADVEGIRTYLAGGFIKGLGAKMVDRLVRKFKDRTLDVIENHPHQLTDVKGIGPAMAERITMGWKDHHAVRSLMNFLQENGIKTAYCARILKAYGTEAEQILREDPFRAASDIPRIGFMIADALTRYSDLDVDTGQRSRACVLHLLEQAADDGHMFLPEARLISRCEDLFDIDLMDTETAIVDLSDMEDIVVTEVGEFAEDRAVYAAPLYASEVDIARRLTTMQAIPLAPPDLDAARITAEVVRRLAIKPSPDQIEVIEGVLAHRVAVITGGPGTGKTTLIRSIAAILETLGKQTLLAAPTGRAARRLADVAGKKASTIHRLLGYNLSSGCFDKDQDNPLEADAVIIDEASMVDALLMYHLIRAIPVTSMLILVGDVFQLPSVGPGNVLSDLITSGVIHTYELERIFRQSEESPIVRNAHKVRRGEPLELSESDTAGELSEFYFIQQATPEKVTETIIDMCTRHIPENFGFHPVKDIQVLTPIHNGVAGTHSLNKKLQAVLNTSDTSVQAPGGVFKTGDKVMHLRNNYQKSVFNGDIGTIVDLDREAENIRVDYDGNIVAYHFFELDELALAYAISIHKSQGSEYPAVVLPVITHHYTMLQRNLLYTALTRGKSLVVLVGSAKAVSIALKNDTPRRRLSGLSFRLSSA